MIDIVPLPAFSDNYLWLLSRQDCAVIVDPGDAAPVQQRLERQNLRLEAILITHWHPDHIGGIAALLKRWPVPVYGPRAEAARIPALTHPLDAGDRVHLPALALDFEVLALPGHTLGHIAYLAPGLLFCGDTLFSAGCGRLFEGTPAQMHDALTRLARLPADTAVYCTHEYTLSNLAFAAAVDAPAVADEIPRVQALRAAGRPSLPTSIGHERRINPFLRCDAASVRAAAEAHAGRALDSSLEVFAELRRWKDGFKQA